MDTVKKRQPSGSLKISQEVIATIASVATLEIDGVDSLAERESNMAKVFSKGIGKKSIDVTLNDDFAVIDIGLNLKFGAHIPEVCAAVQNNVKDNVQTMTGIAVSKVNVTVAGIAFPGEAAQ